MAHSYSHLFGIPCTGLRFFTVYGPWGRPDMSPIQFARAIAQDRVLQLFNHGEHQRDFTYIDDIVESIARLIDRAPQVTPLLDHEQPDPATSRAPWRIYNIGGQHPVALRTYVELLEKHLGQTARIELLPLQAGMCSTPAPMPATWHGPPASNRVSNWTRAWAASSSGSSITTHGLPTHRSRLNACGPTSAEESMTRHEQVIEINAPDATSVSIRSTAGAWTRPSIARAVVG